VITVEPARHRSTASITSPTDAATAQSDVEQVTIIKGTNTAPPNDHLRRMGPARGASIAFLVLIIALNTLLTACNVDKSLDDVISRIDAAREIIDSQSTAWRDELTKLTTDLNDLEGKASADTKEVVTQTISQVADLTNQTIQLTDAKVQNLVAQAGVEARCNADFVRASVSNALQYMVDDLKFWKGNLKHKDTPPPHGNCWVNPSVLSLYPNGDKWSVDTANMSDKGVVHIFGYQYRAESLPQVELQDIHGTVIRAATIRPAYVTRYQVDLDLAGETFADVKPGSRLVLRWPDSNDRTTISLTLHSPADLVITNAEFTPSSPHAGVDATLVKVTVKNTGDVRSGPFIASWQPDPQQPAAIIPIRFDPLNPGQDHTGSSQGYTYLRDGLIRSTITLDNSGSAVTPAVTVQPPPHIPLPPKDLPPFPLDQTKTGNVIGGFGEDVTYGGPCESGYVQGPKPTLTYLGSKGNAKASFKNDSAWASADPSDCRVVVHFSIQNHAPDPNWITVKVGIMEQGI
jgi:hypothetical protein